MKTVSLRAAEADLPRTRRIGFLAGRISVPDDFDTMHREEIIRLFEGDADA